MAAMTIPGRNGLDAVVSLDPALRGPSGVCVRFVRRLAETRRKLPDPDWVWHGNVMSQAFADELAKVLFTGGVGLGRVLFVTEATAYGSLTIARSLGRATGAVESLLAHLGLTHECGTMEVTSSVWRQSVLPIKPHPSKSRTARREAWKQLAQLYVKQYHLYDATPDEAEAVAINDFACGKLYR